MPHKFVIQRFVPTRHSALEGEWRNTSWGDDDRQKAIENADRIAASENMQLRVMEKIHETPPSSSG